VVGWVPLVAPRGGPPTPHPPPPHPLSLPLSLVYPTHPNFPPPSPPQPSPGLGCWLGGGWGPTKPQLLFPQNIHSLARVGGWGGTFVVHPPTPHPHHPPPLRDWWSVFGWCFGGRFGFVVWVGDLLPGFFVQPPPPHPQNPLDPPWPNRKTKPHPHPPPPPPPHRPPPPPPSPMPPLGGGVWGGCVVVEVGGLVEPQNQSNKTPTQVGTCWVGCLWGFGAGPNNRTPLVQVRGAPTRSTAGGSPKKQKTNPQHTPTPVPKRPGVTGGLT